MWRRFKRWFQKKFLGYVDPGVYIEEVFCPQVVSLKEERVLGIIALKKTPCPVLDPVKVPTQEADNIFGLKLIDPRSRLQGMGAGVVMRIFSKDPKRYCSRCQTDHVQYTAIENMKSSCCEEPIAVAEQFLVGPAGPLHTRCAREHVEK